MKVLFIALFTVGMLYAANAQNPTPAKAGVKYGAKISTKGAIAVDDIASKMTEAKEWKGIITGEVVQVCEKKGCWMKLKTADGDMIVRFKNYGFFMPLDIVGKTIVAEGKATLAETSVDELKHYAEDAKKSKEEIDAITNPKKETSFEAKGVVVIK
jgi:hypothetical protein